MSTRMEPRELKIAGGVLLLGSFLAFLAGFVSNYADWHNAYYRCVDRAWPPDALPMGAGFRGQDTTLFPVAGVECHWNGAVVGAFDTLVPNAFTTVAVWLTLGTLIAGIVALALAKARRTSPAA